MCFDKLSRVWLCGALSGLSVGSASLSFGTILKKFTCVLAGESAFYKLTPARSWQQKGKHPKPKPILL
jgi:hypothetical protein